jgi:hypothetical protein
MLIIGSLLTTLPAFYLISAFSFGENIVHHQDVILYCRSLFGSLVDDEEEVPLD